MPGYNASLRLIIPLIAVLAVLAVTRSMTLAHAELDTASPPAGGTVTSLPASLTLIFTEEVKPGAVSVTVTGPGGERVDNGGAAVDLNDPERITVTVPLLKGQDGLYSVEWQALSNLDGDQTSGTYTFSVLSIAGSPVSTTAATPDDPAGGLIIVPSATIDPQRNGNPLPANSDYDSRAFAISVGAGLVALAAIAGFWFLVRPRNPRFGPRSHNGQE